MDRKEAIEIVKSNFPNGKTQLSEALMTLIPELKENGNRIRKELIEHFRWNAQILSDFDNKDVIAWLEKQGEQKSKDKYTFKSIPRLLDMIKPTDRAKGYCQKLIDSLQQEGYVTDAKIISEHLKLMNGEEVVMTTMDGKHGELIDKPTKEQVWGYCDKVAHEWRQITMDKWESLSDESKNKYHQFIDFNDFSDILVNITAGALFQLIDTGKLEYKEGNLWLENPDCTSASLEVTNEKQDNSVVQETIKNEQDDFSKFHEGDWIISNDWKNVYRIKSINCGYCSLENINGIVHCPCMPPSESDFHHWTIQDAKDGDILAYRVDNEKILIIIYEGLGKSFDGEVGIHALLDGDYFSESAVSICCKFMKDLTPATKDQRDLLFAKMRQAGYEWDAELKELRGGLEKL